MINPMIPRRTPSLFPHWIRFPRVDRKRKTKPASEPAERSNMDTTAENVNDQTPPVTEETEESFDDYVVEIGEDAEVGGN